MPRYKRPPKGSDKQTGVIIGLGDKPNDMVVQKTSPLLMLHNTQLDLFDYKLLDAYLGRINSHNPNRREIKFKKGELEDLFGLTRIRSDMLSAHLDRLLLPVTVDIESPGGKGWLKFHLFSTAKAYKSDDGLWTVAMKCSEEAEQFFFYPDKLRYLRYLVREIAKLQSKHSYKLFMYLESRRYFGLEWTVDLDELKTILCCENIPTYDEFKEFNKSVLRKAQKELEEKTQCRFSYEPLYYDIAGNTYRRVVAVRFTLEAIPEEAVQSAPEQAALPAGGAVAPDMPDDTDTDDPNNAVVRIRFACDDPIFSEFSMAQLQELMQLAFPLKRNEDVERYKQDVGIIQAVDLATADVLKEHILAAYSYKASNLYRYVLSSLRRANSPDQDQQDQEQRPQWQNQAVLYRRNMRSQRNFGQQRTPFTGAAVCPYDDDGYMDQLLASEPPSDLVDDTGFNPFY